ncbi:5241_t:CDS:2 [Acaulospora morrowiae]|uniref:5241_t:CDS:1 n=1 Tax=Acaulospora morrowiae TaxID=94023 RepID=A0A9N9IVA4_9GLOM|nr:5241_t:CDS:2 [Acaulospora morrowiae]
MAYETPFILSQYGSLRELEQFTRELPKVELHAHLNGSISPETLQHLVDHKKEEKPELVNFRIPKQKLDTINEDSSLPQTILLLSDAKDGPLFFVFFSSFFTIFHFIYQLTDDEEAVAYITESVIRDFHKDGVKYLELRSTPRKNENNGMTSESYVKAIISVIQKFPSSECNIIVRLILSVNRKDTLESAMETVDLAIKYKKAGVVGVDLCNDPTVGEHLKSRAEFDEYEI